MKSLEIIDDLLFDFLDDAIDESATFISKGELEEIKQSLEVLEIIKKYLKIGNLEMFENCKFIDLVAIWEQFQNKDYNRIKQWLEENE